TPHDAPSREPFLDRAANQMLQKRLPTDLFRRGVEEHSVELLPLSPPRCDRRVLASFTRDAGWIPSCEPLTHADRKTAIHVQTQIETGSRDVVCVIEVYAACDQKAKLALTSHKIGYDIWIHTNAQASRQPPAFLPEPRQLRRVDR